MTIRPARAEDLSDLLRLAGQLGYTPEPAEVEATLAKLDGESHAVLVACEGEAVVGWIELQRFGLLSSGEEAHISGLVVDERYRGAGVGSLLVEAAEAWARRFGVSAIRVRSRVTRERAHGFYLKRGYEEIKRQVVFRKEL